MKKGFIFIFLITFFYFGFAQVNIQSTLEPETILMGDTASLNIQIGIDKDLTIELPKLGDSLNRYLEILEVKTDSSQRGRNKMYAQNLTLIGFEPGDFLVNSISYMIDGELHQTKSHQLTVLDIPIDSTKMNPYPIKSIMDEKVTWWEKNKKYVWYMVAGLILLAIIIYLIYLYIKDIRKKKYSSKPLLPPYEEAKENLRKLDKQELWQNGRIQEYYTDLSYILRRYISRRFEFSALALLSDDLVNYLRKEDILYAKDAAEMEAFLHEADLVKFAKKTPTTEKHLEYRKSVEQIIDITKPIIEEQNEHH